MSETKKVLVLCDDFRSIKRWFNNVLDVYMDCNLVTSFNRHKNKICMLGDYIWYFKVSGRDGKKDQSYYKIYTQTELEERWKKEGWKL